MYVAFLASGSSSCAWQSEAGVKFEVWVNLAPKTHACDHCLLLQGEWQRVRRCSGAAPEQPRTLYQEAGRCDERARQHHHHHRHQRQACQAARVCLPIHGLCGGKDAALLLQQCRQHSASKALAPGKVRRRHANSTRILALAHNVSWTRSAAWPPERGPSCSHPLAAWHTFIFVIVI